MEGKSEKIAPGENCTLQLPVVVRTLSATYTTPNEQYDARIEHKNAEEMELGDKIGPGLAMSQDGESTYVVRRRNFGTMWTGLASFTFFPFPHLYVLQTGTRELSLSGVAQVVIRNRDTIDVPTPRFLWLREGRFLVALSPSVSITDTRMRSEEEEEEMRRRREKGKKE